MSGAVAAIVVAAGRSQRMGSCKQLLDLGGKTVLAHCLGSLQAGGVADIIVVISAQGEAVATEALRFPVQLVVNADPVGDMASSVLCGRRAVAASVSGVLVTLSDYPLVSPETISRLVAAHGTNPASILIPCHGEQRGHPTLFPAACLAELRAGLTLRDLVRRDPGRIRLIAVDDPGTLRDMDTREDYLLVQRQFTSRQLKE